MIAWQGARCIKFTNLLGDVVLTFAIEARTLQVFRKGQRLILSRTHPRDGSYPKCTMIIQSVDKDTICVVGPGRIPPHISETSWRHDISESILSKSRLSVCLEERLLAFTFTSHPPHQSFSMAPASI